MNKTLKKVLLGVAIAAVSVGALWGGLTVLRSAKRQPVNVYPVSSFMTTNEWGNASQSSGTVTTDKLQKVFLSSTQTVQQVYVTEGQTVKKGDKLLSYDSTLTNIDLERSRIALERQETAMAELKQKLDDLDKCENKVYWKLEKSKVDAQLEAAKAAARAAAGAGTDAPVPSVDNITTQDGTAAHPRYVQDNGFTPNYMENLRAVASATDIYVVVYHSDPVDGDESVQGVVLHQGSDVMTFFDPAPIPTADDTASADAAVKALQLQSDRIARLLDNPDIPDDMFDTAKRKYELEKQIDAANVTLQIARLDFKKKESEMADSAVYSTQDGTVRAVRDPKEAYQNNEAVVEVSGGGGYYVTGAISELDLGNVKLGDTVQINSWMTGVSCEGKIVSVEDYPTTQTGWSNGNQNVSYYPFKAFVEEDAQLQANDYVDITYRGSGSGRNAWYLENMFIRNDSGKSFVYVRGEDGLLEKRDIVTGGDLWGSYTEIRGGLTQDDLVAFPYGKDVTDGARTQEATPDQLYNGIG